MSFALRKRNVRMPKKIMIFTSYFANLRNIDKSRICLSIARKTPESMSIESFPFLFPDGKTLFLKKSKKIDEREYEERYFRNTLSPLSANDLAKEFNGKVLLCYEKPEDFCHRALVRKWFLSHGHMALEYQKEYKIAVVGSREYADFHEFVHIMKRLVSSFDPSQKIEIISGGAAGTDSMARTFAERENLTITEILPDWNRYGKSAGFVRNEQIWRYVDFGIAFWDGTSKGTEHSLHLAKNMGKTLVVYNYRTKTFSIVF